MIKNQITSALEQVTMNGINLRSLNINKIPNLSEKNDLSSEDGLVKEYKRLSIQLKQLQILEKRYTDQLEQHQTDEDELTKNMRKFSNLEALRYESTKKIEELASHLEELKHKQKVTEDVVDEAKRRNEEIREQLSNNENFRQISHLEEKLADLTEELDRTQKLYDEIKNVKDFFLDFIFNFLIFV